jgi:hypothetical protein
MGGLMTLKAFIGFPRKPNKSPGAAVARAFGMKEKPNSSEFEWVFQKTKFRVMLEDLREQMKPDVREWADEVGWTYTYAIQVAVHTKRDSLDYLKWVSLVTVLMEAYETSTVWYDEGTDTPQERMRLTEFAPLAVEFNEEGQLDNLEVEIETEVATPPSKEDDQMNDLPPGLLDMIRKEIHKESSTHESVQDTEEKPESVLTLQPVEVEQDVDFEDFEDWDDDDEDDDADDEDDDGEVQPVTWE